MRVGLTLEYAATLRTEELCPARWIAGLGRCPLIRWLSAIAGDAMSARLISVDRQEFDAEPNRSEWLHAVLDVGWNGLEGTGLEGGDQPRLGRCREPQPPAVNGDPSPQTAGQLVAPEQAGGNGVLVPL